MGPHFWDCWTTVGENQIRTGAGPGQAHSTRSELEMDQSWTETGPLLVTVTWSEVGVMVEVTKHRACWPKGLELNAGDLVQVLFQDVHLVVRKAPKWNGRLLSCCRSSYWPVWCMVGILDDSFIDLNNRTVVQLLSCRVTCVWEGSCCPMWLHTVTTPNIRPHLSDVRGLARVQGQWSYNLHV